MVESISPRTADSGDDRCRRHVRRNGGKSKARAGLDAARRSGMVLSAAAATEPVCQDAGIAQICGPGSAICMDKPLRNGL